MRIYLVRAGYVDRSGSGNSIQFRGTYSAINAHDAKAQFEVEFSNDLAAPVDFAIEIFRQ